MTLSTEPFHWGKCAVAKDDPPEIIDSVLQLPSSCNEIPGNWPEYLQCHIAELRNFWTSEPRSLYSTSFLFESWNDSPKVAVSLNFCSRSWLDELDCSLGRRDFSISCYFRVTEFVYSLPLKIDFPSFRIENAKILWPVKILIGFSRIWKWRNLSVSYTLDKASFLTTFRCSCDLSRNPLRKARGSRCCCPFSSSISSDDTCVRMSRKCETDASVQRQNSWSSLGWTIVTGFQNRLDSLTACTVILWPLGFQRHKFELLVPDTSLLPAKTSQKWFIKPTSTKEPCVRSLLPASLLRRTGC